MHWLHFVKFNQYSRHIVSAMLFLHIFCNNLIEEGFQSFAKTDPLFQIFPYPLSHVLIRFAFPYAIAAHDNEEEVVAGKLYYIG